MLAGGYNHEVGLMDAAEVSEDFGVSFRALPALPRAVQGSCLVLVDDRAIIIGGFDGKYRVTHQGCSQTLDSGLLHWP